MKDYAIIINHVRKTSITSVIQIFSAHYLWYLITSSSKDPHTSQGRPHQPNRSTNYQLVSWSVSVWPLACLWGSLSPQRSRPDQNAVISHHTCSEHYTGHDVWARGEDSISDTERLYNCLTGFCLRCEMANDRDIKRDGQTKKQEVRNVSTQLIQWCWPLLSGGRSHTTHIFQIHCQHDGGNGDDPNMAARGENEHIASTL